MDNYTNKYCPNCGNELPNEAIFCGNCGYSFENQNTQQTDYSNQQNYDATQPYYGDQNQYTTADNQQDYGVSSPDYSYPAGYAVYPPNYGTSYQMEPPRKGGAGKIAAIVIVIVLVLALIATGAYFVFFYDGGMFSSDDDDDEVTTSETVSPTPSAKPTKEPKPTRSPKPTSTPSPSPSPSPTPEFYIIPDSSTRYLTENDLVSLTPQQLTIARNEIYARHGRQFQTQWLQDYFNTCPWYTVNPYYNYSNEDSMLSEFELSNAKFILSYENSHN